ncbi:MAG: hypothetical protein A2428_13030 [Bdellovibrionales bacterium RIFOXYC1_FULL_54_43]|nr:MAG: hypothetical protein A2428_13030 [Bdellovibrionales bacterium RIFOXYC1_FULL_54_43]OFZ79626.1 MAG: hypothetical protein A2603_03945 [Bdellovibrionales bacterium RIFOXYD1_FULL_55_31]
MPEILVFLRDAKSDAGLLPASFEQRRRKTKDSGPSGRIILIRLCVARRSQTKSMRPSSLLDSSQNDLFNYHVITDSGH